RPRYLRGLLWSDGPPRVRLAADISLTEVPLPDVPEVFRQNSVVNQTLRARPDLFQIVTPIDVEEFEFLLGNHPNQPFVQSVLRGLREGFWPWAEMPGERYPDTWDASKPPPADPREAQFLRDQRDEEVSLGRFSPSFGTKLLPGMYSMPIHAVPKPRSDKLRLVTNHSAGEYSLNSMISHEAIAGVVLDSIPALGQMLR
ncbi:hypothetical protein B0H21DRAFT_674457, partial [Amylocystis lapponica]